MEFDSIVTTKTKTIGEMTFIITSSDALVTKVAVKNWSANTYMELTRIEFSDLMQFVRGYLSLDEKGE